MEKSNINRIIRKFLSARFSPETEEKVQKWIIEDKDIEAKEKASLEYWNELDVKSDPGTYSALERVNLRTGYNKEHLFISKIHPYCRAYHSRSDACGGDTLLHAF